MITGYTIKRTSADDPDFRMLIAELDSELWVELEEDQATYDPFNKVEHIDTVIVLYFHDEPVACGCYKEVNQMTIEIKRMFVRKAHRGKGLAKEVLGQLERWALERNYRLSVLETSIHFQTARQLYSGYGYHIIENYGPYAGLEDSICMKKELV